MTERSIRSYSRTSGSRPGLDNRGKTNRKQPSERRNCGQNRPSHIQLTLNFAITHPCDKVSRQTQLPCHWNLDCGGTFMERNSLERATAFALRISRRSFFVPAGLRRCHSPPPFILVGITHPKTK